MRGGRPLSGDTRTGLDGLTGHLPHPDGGGRTSSSRKIRGVQERGLDPKRMISELGTTQEPVLPWSWWRSGGVGLQLTSAEENSERPWPVRRTERRLSSPPPPSAQISPRSALRTWPGGSQAWSCRLLQVLRVTSLLYKLNAYWLKTLLWFKTK